MTVVEGMSGVFCHAKSQPRTWLGTKGTGVHPVLANKYESYSSY